MKREKDFGKVTDEEITKVWEYANFGYRDCPEKERSRIRRKIVEQGVLKIQTGYHNGHTLKCILIELGLLTKKLHVTSKGRRFMYRAFCKGDPRAQS